MGYRRRKSDPVRRHANARIDREIDERVRDYAHADDAQIGRRIAELEREWDMERVLQVNAASLGLAGLALGALHDRRWLALPAAVLPFLVQHAVQGWCPPASLLRRLGLRTRKEIEAERYALKLLRGDLEPARGRLDPGSVLRGIRR